VFGVTALAVMRGSMQQQQRQAPVTIRVRTTLARASRQPLVDGSQLVRRHIIYRTVPLSGPTGFTPGVKSGRRVAADAANPPMVSTSIRSNSSKTHERTNAKQLRRKIRGSVLNDWRLAK
jgi:hypothetical protein